MSSQPRGGEHVRVTQMLIYSATAISGAALAGWLLRCVSGGSKLVQASRRQMAAIVKRAPRRPIGKDVVKAVLADLFNPRALGRSNQRSLSVLSSDRTSAGDL